MSEPYFNEAGYERQKGTQQGLENSRMYNEMVVLKVVQSMTRLTMHPPEAFKDEVNQHLKENAQRYHLSFRSQQRILKRLMYVHGEFFFLQNDRSH